MINNRNCLGFHLIVEAYGCDFGALDDVAGIEKSMQEAVLISGATPLQSAFQKFEPQGVSGVIIISESHFTIHTWPELGYAAIDIFTCGNTIQHDPALEHLKSAFGAEKIEYKEFERGHEPVIAAYTKPVAVDDKVPVLQK